MCQTLFVAIIELASRFASRYGRVERHSSDGQTLTNTEPRNVANHTSSPALTRPWSSFHRLMRE